MTPKLTVKLVEPSAASRLVPVYKSEVGVLALESPVARELPHGMLVDGCLVFDLDADRLVAIVDLHLPRSRWAVSEKVRWPESVTAAGLVVSDEAVKTEGFDDEVWAHTNADGTVVVISIGNQEPDRWWALSDHVLAATCSDELVGFVVRLYA